MAAKKATKKATTKRGGARRGAGRPAYVGTDEQRKQVLKLKGLGLNHSEVASFIINPATGKGIGREVLQRVFRAELDMGMAHVKGEILGALMNHALGDGSGAVAACIFYAKTQCGWRETQEVHVTGTGVLVAPAAVSPEDWIAGEQSKNRMKVSEN